MEDRQQKNQDVLKWIQTIVLAITTAAILGTYSRLGDLNDRLIRLEERATVNTEHISSIETSVNKIQMEQFRGGERMTKLEFEITENKSK